MNPFPHFAFLSLPRPPRGDGIVVVDLATVIQAHPVLQEVVQHHGARAATVALLRRIQSDYLVRGEPTLVIAESCHLPEGGDALDPYDVRTGHPNQDLLAGLTVLVPGPHTSRESLLHTSLCTLTGESDQPVYLVASANVTRRYLGCPAVLAVCPRNYVERLELSQVRHQSARRTAERTLPVDLVQDMMRAAQSDQYQDKDVAEGESMAAPSEDSIIPPDAEACGGDSPPPFFDDPDDGEQP